MALAANAYRPTFPFAGAANQPGSTAIPMSSNAIVAWADGYTNVQYGADVAEGWKTPVKALGPATGTSFDVVVLGRRGQITLTFSQGISDGAGFDFAVFENSVSDSFLELGWVEVSSDGTNFVRFPSYSYTDDPVAAFGTVDPTFIHGFGGKYRQGYGTPFDLAELQLVADAIQAGSHSFSSDYVSAFTNNFPSLDVSNVQYVRIVDIAGDGLDLDSEGFSIYDPYPTSITAGFDLDAVGVMNQPAPSGLAQHISFDAIPHQKLTFGSVALNAVADSGLPVSFAVQSGPAIVLGNVLSFAGTGVVEVVASQPGDTTYAPALPVLRSFRIAEEIQHIFVEPVANQLQGGGAVQVNAYSSSGLPVQMEVYDGPFSVSIGETNHVLHLGSETGNITLRAYQSGTSAVAPADDVFVDFNIVIDGATNAPILFDDWLAVNERPNLSIQSGVDVFGRSSVLIDYAIDRRMLGRSHVVESGTLSAWSNTVPEIVEWTGGASTIHLKVQLTAEEAARYYRLVLEEQ